MSSGVDRQERTDRASPPAAPLPGARGISALRRLAAALRRHMLLFIGIVVAVTTAAGIATALQTPRFTAHAEIVLDPAGQGLEAITSPAAARRVAAWLARESGGPSATAGEAAVDRLRDHVAAEALPGTLSVRISYTADSPQEAARIANAFARLPDGPPRMAAGRIISAAVPPTAASSPRPFVNLLVGALAGIVLGFAAVLLAERHLSGLTSGAEVEGRLGLHHLGSIPALASVLPEARSPVDAVADSPRSGFAEAFRSLIQAIHFSGSGRAQVVAITSALPGEGKSAIAAALARSIALSGEIVLLIDCAGGSSAMLRTSGNHPGAMEVLSGEALLEEAIARDRVSGAYVLALGRAGGPSALPAEQQMIALIDELRSDFPRILIDAPSLVSPVEANWTAATSDLVVVAVRWRRTANRIVRAALKPFAGTRVRIGGVVLSQVDMRRQVRYADGDPSFYYRQCSKYYS